MTQHNNDLSDWNLSDCKQKIYDSLVEADRQIALVIQLRTERLDEYVDGVDISKLPPLAQHILWLLYGGGVIGSNWAAMLDAELNELRRKK